MRNTIGVCLVVLTCACGVEPLATQVAPITGGSLHQGHPAVAMVNLTNNGLAGGSCTGTLVGQRTVLTAAHCVSDGLRAETVRFDTGEKIDVQSATPHPWYTNQPADDWYDFAILRLSRAPGVTPHAVAAKRPPPGMPLVLVGFGVTMCESSYADCTNDQGVKRITTNRVDRLTATELSFVGKGSICSGDSGGPAFARYQGREVQVGVSSRAIFPCGNDAIDGRPDAVLDWIRSAAQGDVVVDSTAPGSPGAPGSQIPSDMTAPVVSIASPADGAVVAGGALTVKVKAFDPGLTAVRLFLDNKPQGGRAAPPFDFALVVRDVGPHTLRAEAEDEAGNIGVATSRIEVAAKTLGAACAGHGECESGFCLDQGGARYCTAFCTAAATCGAGYRCAPTNDPSNGVCTREGPPGTPVGADAAPLALVGGCAVGGTAPGARPWLWLLLLVFFRRRRC